MVPQGQRYLGHRRTHIQFADLCHLRNHHEYSNQEHSRRFTYKRSAGRSDITLQHRRTTYEASDPTIQEEARHQTLGYALHLAVSLNDRGLRMVLLFVRPHTLHLQPFHPRDRFQ
jgi:hypothetical protein